MEGGNGIVDTGWGKKDEEGEREDDGNWRKPDNDGRAGQGAAEGNRTGDGAESKDN